MALKMLKHGKGFAFALADLPSAERMAYLEAQIEELGLEQGTYDDDAHAHFLTASTTRRDRAERYAAMARLCVALERKGCTWSERLELIQAAHGKKGCSIPTLKRLLRQVEGLDPINFAPALLDDYKGGSPEAKISEEA